MFRKPNPVSVTASNPKANGVSRSLLTCDLTKALPVSKALLARLTIFVPLTTSAILLALEATLATLPSLLAPKLRTSVASQAAASK